MKTIFSPRSSILLFSSFLIIISAFLFVGGMKTNSTYAVGVNDSEYNCGDNTKDASYFDSDVIKNTFPACTSIDTGDLGFKIPSLGQILTFIVRAFFAIAGLAALLYLLLGALAWITSGGDKDAVSAAQQKIQAAVIGIILIVGVLSIIWTLEQIIFNRRICLGLSCPLTLPGLVEQSGNGFCCVCAKPDGTNGDIINSSTFKCGNDGLATSL